MYEVVNNTTAVNIQSGEQGQQSERDTTYTIVRGSLDDEKVSSNNPDRYVPSTITSEQMDLYGDYSVKDAMARVTGFQVDMRRELNLRGVGHNRYNVTLNGFRMGSTGMGDRSFDLGSISADMIYRVEVARIIRPDMDADALAGNVNVVTHRPDVGDIDLNARLGGGATPRYFSYTAPGSRVTLDYSHALTEDISISLNLVQQMEAFGREFVALDYDAFDFGDGFVDVYERVAAGMQSNERSRIGGGIQLTYRPTESAAYFIRSMFINDIFTSNRHQNIWDTGQDWIRPDSTGAAGRRGIHTYDAFMQNKRINHYSLQAGAGHVFDSFYLNYGASWSFNKTNYEELLYPFEAADLNFAIDMEEPNKPIVSLTNVALLRDGTLDRRRFIFEPVDRLFNEHLDNTLNARIDVQFPFHLGSIKIGSSANATFKDGVYRETNYSYASRLNLSHFEVIKRGAFDPFDHYNIPWLIEPETARYFYQSARPSFIKDENLEREKSDIWNYLTREQIYSGYGMVELNLGRFFTLLGGARIEHTIIDSDGRNVLMDDAGNHEETLKVNDGNNYTNFFPNAQIAFAPGEQTTYRIAYSRAIGRPDYNLLAPFKLINSRDSLLVRGNPKLKPVTSDNFDVQFERSIRDFGAASINLFYKQLSGFVVDQQQTITSGEFADWEEITYTNDDEKASIYGFEVFFSSRLHFLPGFLNNFSVIGNYTWSHSEYEVAFRDDSVPLPNHSPHVVNTALQYDFRRISGQISYHWTSKSLFELEQSTRLAPSVDPTQTVSMDRYQDNWTDLSASIRIQLTDRFRFWADAHNLLNVERIRYEHSRDLYPRITELRGGRTFRAGIRFIL